MKAPTAQELFEELGRLSKDKVDLQTKNRELQDVIDLRDDEIRELRGEIWRLDTQIANQQAEYNELRWRMDGLDK